MKIHEFFEDVQDDDSHHTLKNPIQNITSTDPRFEDWYDRAEAVLFKYLNPNLPHAKAITKVWREYGKLTDVPINQTMGSEEFLDPRGPTSSNPAKIVRIDGIYFVIDGNHRVAKAYLEGKTTVRALVVNIDDTLHEKRESRRNWVKEFFLRRKKGLPKKPEHELELIGGGKETDDAPNATALPL